MGGKFGDLIIIFLVGFALFGGDRLPGIGKAIGTALNEFKKAMNGQPENQNSQPQSQTQPAALAVAPATRKTRRAPARKTRKK